MTQTTTTTQSRMTESRIRATAELIHDSFELTGETFHDRGRDVIETTGVALAATLLAAGWLPPTRVLPSAHS